MKKITIINAYGDKNIGDAAILTIALQFIKEAYRDNCQISVLCEDTQSVSSFINNSNNISALQLPYGYAIRGNKKVSYFTKISRFMIIHINTYALILLNKYLRQNLPTKGFYSYINEIKNADIVVGMGGGYFITTDKIKDYFGLMLSLITVNVAKFYKKKIVFYPMSFGPFASKLQEYITYKSLINTTVISRDEITLQKIKSIDKEGLIKTFYAPDLALFLPNIEGNITSKLASNYIVLTAREWFSDKSKQNAYESSLSQFVDFVFDRYSLHTIFIPMGKNPIEDDDNRLALRLVGNLKNKGIFSIKSPDRVDEVQSILNNAKIAVCTRMHSAILSCTVGTPFIAIGYGHKTLGFMRSFNLEKWHIDINNVNFDNLSEEFIKLNIKDNYSKFIDTVIESMENIKKYKMRIIQSIENNE